MKQEPRSTEQHETSSDMLDAQWQALAADWQSQPVEKTDIKGLINKTKKRIIKAQLCLLLNVIVTLGIIVALIYGLVVNTWPLPTLFYLTFGSLFSLLFVYLEIKIRWRSWQNNCTSPDKAIENAIANCQSSIKYIQLTKWSCYLLFPAANWYIYEIGEISARSSWPPFIFLNVIIVGLWVVSHYYHKQRLLELNQLNRLITK